MLDLLYPFLSKKFDLFYFNFVIKLIFIFCTLKISLFLEEKSMYNEIYNLEDSKNKKILKNNNDESFTFQWVRERRNRLVFTKKLNKNIAIILNEIKK